MEERFQIGIISSTHGVKGEVKVFPTTDDSKRFRKLKSVMVDTGREAREMEIEGIKFSNQIPILKFKGIDSLDEVLPYKGKGLWVNRADAVKLAKNEYFIADLLGMTVVDEAGERLGELADVIETGANDVYVVNRGGDQEVLLPAIKECILEVDVEKGEMRVHVMDGLLEQD